MSANPVNWTTLPLLYLPFLLSKAVEAEPSQSWWVAWLGSSFILWMTWSGKTGGLPTHLTIRQKIFHPLYLVQALFAGYGFMTSLFLWLDVNGIAPVQPVADSYWGIHSKLADAQQDYVLAHAAFATGMLLTGRKVGQQVRGLRWSGSAAKFLILVSVVSLVVGQISMFLPGMRQLAVIFSRLALVTGCASLGPGLLFEGRPWLPASVALNTFFLLQAAASGWKEEVIVMVILISLATFPFFPKTTTLFGITAFILAWFVLPVMTETIRLKWREVSKQEALRAGLNSLKGLSTRDYLHKGWIFGVNRASEVEMLVRYKESLAARRSASSTDGFQIIKQAVLAPIPRFIWPTKPDLEKLVAERVYAHNIVSDQVFVSAKPHPVADGYLIGGRPAMVGLMLCIGVVSSLAYSFCVSRFGGWIMGGIFFHGLFSILWRGNSLEFMVNSVVWSWIIGWLLDRAFLSLGITAPADRVQVHQPPATAAPRRGSKVPRERPSRVGQNPSTR